MFGLLVMIIVIFLAVFFLAKRSKSEEEEPKPEEEKMEIGPTQDFYQIEPIVHDTEYPPTTPETDRFMAEPEEPIGGDVRPDISDLFDVGSEE